ncbi:hypothetical protein ACIQU6_09580 [Streptomyces sp. NPDC090442]|uniref:hypothetical protein n=1 Tax=Streptomyces sp. NPDC090442 TaxID=3365962 RepID=UPI0037F3157B
MSTRTVDLAPVLAGDVSDRAFRLYRHLVLDSRSHWDTLQAVADACNLTNHQARWPLAELRSRAMVESRRANEMGNHGRKTWRTYARIAEANSGAAA